MAHPMEQLRAAEKLLSDFTSQEEAFRKEALLDGEIDEEEEIQLARISKKVKDVTEVVAAKRTEIEENKRLWASMSGNLETFKNKTEGLSRFDHPGAAECNGLIGEIETAAETEFWKEAVDGLRRAQAILAPHYSDFIAQVAQQDKDAEVRKAKRSDVSSRLEALRKKVTTLSA